MLLATDGTRSSLGIPRVLAAWGNAFRGLPVEVLSVAPRNAFVTPWGSAGDEEVTDPTSSPSTRASPTRWQTR